MNILMRLELMEQTVKLISSQAPIETLIRKSRNENGVIGLSRNRSNEKISHDSQEYMSLIGKRKVSLSSAKARSPPVEQQDPNFGKIAAFNVKDLSMYAAVS